MIMVVIEFHFISKVEYPEVISIKVKITISTSSTSHYCLMSKISSLVKRTTKITIRSCYEAAAQRINAIKRPPPPKAM